MKNVNQIISDKINEWNLPQDVADIISDTDINMMGELFGGIESADELIAFVRENYDLYDSFRVSAVFEDGASIDNDIISETGRDAIEAELEVAREWFADKDPEYYLVSYYKDGECLYNERKDA